MRGMLAHLIRLARTDWVGPHFWVDLIRLARKGWPTLARVLYLVTLPADCRLVPVEVVSDLCEERLRGRMTGMHAAAES